MAPSAAVMNVTVSGNTSAPSGCTEGPRPSSPQLHQKESVS